MAYIGEVKANLGGGGNVQWDGTRWNSVGGSSAPKPAVKSSSGGGGSSRGAFGGQNSTNNGALNNGGVGSYGNAPVGPFQSSGGSSAAPKPAAPQAPQAPKFTNPYANLKSQFQGLENPFDPKYRDTIINVNRGAVQKEFDSRLNNVRADAASRGLSQGGTSGIEMQLAAQAEMERNSTLGQINANATQFQTEKSAEFERQRASGVDSINSIKSAGDLAFGQAAFDQYTRLQKMPLEMEGLALDNTGKGLNNNRSEQIYNQSAAMNPELVRTAQLTNDQIAQSIDQAKQKFPHELDRAKVDAAMALLSADQKKEAAAWWAANAGWAGPAEFIGKLIAIGGPTAATYLAGVQGQGGGQGDPFKMPTATMGSGGASVGANFNGAADQFKMNPATAGQPQPQTYQAPASTGAMGQGVPSYTEDPTEFWDMPFGFNSAGFMRQPRPSDALPGETYQQYGQRKKAGR